MKINLTIEISPEEIFSAIRHMDFQEMARLASQEKSAEFIATDPKVKRHNYYLVANDFGQSWVKLSIGECTIAKLSYEGKAEFMQYDLPYKKQYGDTATEITQKDFEDGVRKVLTQLRKDIDI
jgi:hypothetical protein